MKKIEKTENNQFIKCTKKNPQETYVALLNGKIVGSLRSVLCSGPSIHISKKEHAFFENPRIEKLTIEQRKKWWLIISEKHEPNILHSHLGPFGVTPEFQGQGIGSRLVMDYMDRMDKARVPCYIETSKKENNEYYKKFGFKICRN